MGDTPNPLGYRERTGVAVVMGLVRKGESESRWSLRPRTVASLPGEDGEGEGDLDRAEEDSASEEEEGDAPGPRRSSSRSPSTARSFPAGMARVTGDGCGQWRKVALWAMGRDVMDKKKEKESV